MSDTTKYLQFVKRAATHQTRAGPLQGVRSTRFLDANRDPSLRRAIQPKSRSAFVDLVRAMNIRAGDLVQVLYGKDAGSSGVIRSIVPKMNQVIVTGCNMAHTFRPHEDVRVRAKGGAMVKPPPIMSVERPIHITNVAPLDPVIKKPTRIKRRYSMSGECVRISKLSGCAMPELDSPRAPEVAPSFGDRVLRAHSALSHTRGLPMTQGVRAGWDKAKFRVLERMAEKIREQETHGGIRVALDRSVVERRRSDK